MRDYFNNAVKKLLQIVAISLMILIWSMILHKATVDISALARKHSDGEFWVALAKYFLSNLGGG
jgi:hypothetical protein